jgi:hypothetical protein
MPREEPWETVLRLCETMMETENYKFVCPLCIKPFRRYDKLYEHIRNTVETAHKDLAARWFTPSCPVCKKDVSNMFLRHMSNHHNQEYQTIMKGTLHFRPGVEFHIPHAPWCCTPRNFFPYRERTGIVKLPLQGQERTTSEPVAEINPDGSYHSVRPVNSTLHEPPGSEFYGQASL